MADHKTEFSQSWLSKSHSNGNLAKAWLKQVYWKQRLFECFVILVILDCSNKGWKTVEQQHMQNEKHKNFKCSKK